MGRSMGVPVSFPGPRPSEPMSRQSMPAEQQQRRVVESASLAQRRAQARRMV
jgi:hypothetical protein